MAGSYVSFDSGFLLGDGSTAGASETPADLYSAANEAKDKGKVFIPITVGSNTLYINVDHVRWFEPKP